MDDVVAPRTNSLAELNELRIVTVGTVVSAASLRTRHIQCGYLTRWTDVSLWRGYKGFLLENMFYLEFAEQIIFSRRRLVLGTVVEGKCKNAQENVFQQVFHFSRQTYYKKSK